MELMPARSLHYLSSAFIRYPPEYIRGVVVLRKLDRFLLVDVGHADGAINKDQAVLFLGLKIDVYRKRDEVVEFWWEEPLRNELPWSIKRLVVLNSNLHCHYNK